jgi:transketolase
MPQTRMPTMRDAFIAALSELADDDSSIVLVNGDLGFGVLTDFIRNWPSQYINAGVAEQNMTAVACGMALEGARSYTYSIANFTTLRCLEQLRNDVCYHEADVTAVSIGGGFSYGQLGMSHFATEDLAILRALPNMTVVAPSDPWQAFELTKQLHRRGGPTYLRIDKDKAGLPADPGSVTLGKVRTVQLGNDAVIFSIGGILVEALAAAKLLEAEGISVEIIDVHTLKPLDTEGVVAAATKFGVVVTVEEHNVIGGLGGAIAEVCLEAGVAIKAFHRIGIKDLFPTVVGDQRYLRAQYGLDALAIAEAVRAGIARCG